MITGRQVRAARAKLGWKQDMLADKTLVALNAPNAWSPNAASQCMRARTTRFGARSRQPALSSWTRIAAGA